MNKYHASRPYCPEQNGISERKNRTLNDAMRTLMHTSSLPPSLWQEAIMNAVYTQNRIVRKDEILAPIELFFNSRISKPFFMEFGNPVFVTTIQSTRSKLSPHATVMKFLSVDNTHKGFRLWDGSKIVINRNIRPKTNLNIEFNESRHLISSHKEAPEVVPTLRRSERLKEKTNSNTALSLNLSDPLAEPRTFNQALKCVEKDDWLVAMNNELEALKQTGTYELVDLPSGREAIGCKWVYKKKSEPTGTRFKARLVAQGFNQKFGEDYDEVFAPVVRSATTRLLLSIAGDRKLHLEQFDVKSAFLNGSLKETIYMKAPQGMETNKVLLLKKSLYGLKQAAKSWNDMLISTLKSVGFSVSDFDDCLFIYEGDSSIECYLIVHVDDMICACSNKEKLKVIVADLSKNFEIKSLGCPKQFLGLNVHFNANGTIGLCQQHFIAQFAEEFSLENVKPSKFPLQSGYYKIDCPDLLPENTQYRKIIGKLLYVATNTRPDIAASVSILAKRVSQPRRIDYTEALRVMKYLVTTQNLVLQLNNSDVDPQLTSYCDSDFAEDRKDYKSNSGFVCFVNGGAISWLCRKQSLTAQSTTEAEYYALVECLKETLWLRNILKSFNIHCKEPTQIATDSESCRHIIDNGQYASRTKYFGVKYQFIKDHVIRNEVVIRHVSSEDNIADLLTKPLNHVKLEKHRLAINLLARPNS